MTCGDADLPLLDPHESCNHLFMKFILEGSGRSCSTRGVSFPRRYTEGEGFDFGWNALARGTFGVIWNAQQRGTYLLSVAMDARLVLPQTTRARSGMCSNGLSVAMDTRLVNTWNTMEPKVHELGILPRLLCTIRASPRMCADGLLRCECAAVAFAVPQTFFFQKHVLLVV